jgi:hypothetical protein
LKWIGDLPGERINEIASHLYEKGIANYRYPDEGEKRVVRMVSIGRYIGEESKNQKEDMPNILQIELLEVVSFVKKTVNPWMCKTPQRELGFVHPGFCSFSGTGCRYQNSFTVDFRKNSRLVVT